MRNNVHVQLLLTLQSVIIEEIVDYPVTNYKKKQLLFRNYYYIHFFSKFAIIILYCIDVQK